MEGSWLGTDYLGQDVWSRVLAGGGSILMISVLATALGMVLGIVIGVVAAYAGGWLDEAIMRLNDVALAFPQILLALLVLTAVDQPAWWMIVLLVGVSHAPRVARVARGVALGIVSRDFVHSRRGARREPAAGDHGRGAAQHERAAAGRGRAAADLLDRHGRRHRLPRLRHQPGRGRLGR